jgi:hypothetical protein
MCTGQLIDVLHGMWTYQSVKNLIFFIFIKHVVKNIPVQINPMMIYLLMKPIDMKGENQGEFQICCSIKYWYWYVPSQTGTGARSTICARRNLVSLNILYWDIVFQYSHGNTVNQILTTVEGIIKIVVRD